MDTINANLRQCALVQVDKTRLTEVISVRKEEQDEHELH